MEREGILEVLTDWNFWRKERETGIPREEYIDLIKKFLDNVIIAVTGVRRSGKSTILMQYIKGLVDAGLERENTLLVNLEDSRFMGLELKLLNDTYDTYLQYLNPKKKPFIFLDEIQNIENWERFVRSLHERKEAKIFVTGSSSKLLSSELATVLTGRYLTIEVFPLSFKEFLKFKGVVVKDKIDIIAKRIELRRFLNEYLEFGGFPEVVLSENKKELLLKYVEDIIQKDLVLRYKIRKPEKLRSLTKFYLTNTSSLITFNRVAKFLSTPVDTIERFSDYLESACLVFFVKRFSYSLKEQEKAPRKVYCVDIGLRNAFGFKFSKDLGRISENIVFLELRRMQSKNPLIEIYYLRDERGKEVDFVIKEGLKIKQLIQVCWDVESYETKKREIESLVKGLKLLKLKEGLVITGGFEGDEKIGDKKIIYKPLWKWLLES